MTRPKYEPLAKQLTNYMDAAWNDGFFTGVSMTLLTLVVLLVLVYFFFLGGKVL